MTFLPCRVCGHPVTGGTGIGIKSFCCSRTACSIKDTSKNTDAPTIILGSKEFNRLVVNLTKGY